MPKNLEINVDIIKRDGSWKSHKSINKVLVKKVTRRIVQEFDYFNELEEVELSILLTNNTEILNLNKQFRGKAKATNVLSFPNIELSWQDVYRNNVKNSILEFTKSLPYIYLGDVAFCYEVICDEARKQNKSLENHFIHLLVHGILHLIGFDHQYDKEAEIMENLEVKILKDFNIISPYI